MKLGIIETFFVLQFALSSLAFSAPLPTTPVTNPNAGSSPLKKNILQFDGKSYLLPSYLKLLKDANGRFKVDSVTIIDGHKVGNGGDFVRSQFKVVGLQVISFLENTLDGKNLVLNQNLNIDSLKLSLDINKMVVVDDLLIDNTGSVVDAIGLPDLIILNSDSWYDHYDKQHNIYYLVFHEMLRSISVNDDNYVISQSLINFPTDFKLNTKPTSSPPLLAEDNLSSIITASRIATAGSGCLMSAGRQYFDLNLTTNSLELSFADYVAKLTTMTSLDRKNCSLAVPLTLPPKKRLVISLIDLQGQVDGPLNSLANAQVTFEAFMAGTSQKPQIKQIKMNQGSRSFLMRKTNLLSSACGGDAILRLNSNIILNKATALNASNNLSELIQIRKIKIFLNLEDCLN